MQKVLYHVALFAFALLLIATGASAQDTPTEPQTVEVTASDGLTLVGFYSVLADGEPHPAVLLMHMLRGNHGQWNPLVEPLLQAGYQVLAVDLRGHGQTGGDTDWDLGLADVQTWLDWLRQQPEVRPEAISTIGGSIGSNLALIGCANDEQCVTSIALSPGLDYAGLVPEMSLREDYERRSALLVASQRDRYSADSVRAMLSFAQGDIAARIYSRSGHGTEMLLGKRSLIPLMIAWLDEHTPAE